jgi:hypothetical protein
MMTGARGIIPRAEREKEGILIRLRSLSRQGLNFLDLLLTLGKGNYYRRLWNKNKPMINA